MFNQRSSLDPPLNPKDSLCDLPILRFNFKTHIVISILQLIWEGSMSREWAGPVEYCYVSKNEKNNDHRTCSFGIDAPLQLLKTWDVY